MAELKRLCMNCMVELYGNAACVECGFNNSAMQVINPSALPPGTHLHGGRYLVGNVVTSNGEGHTYIGYDSLKNSKVWIREFMPDTMAKRSPQSEQVIPSPELATQFKTLKIDFTDIYNTLNKLESNKGIVPVLNCFEENNTVYSISQYIQSITLDEFLDQIGGILDYNLAVVIFEPLLQTISDIHMNNLVHRGISPETILIDTNGDLRLTGFCISSVRTAKSELPAELYPGYTAPEQYNVTNWQSTWTDVYAISAVLYKVLSGQSPPPANARKNHDSLPAIVKVNPKIPQNISQAIQKGMILQPEHRIETMDIFTGLITYGEEEFRRGDMTKQVDLTGGKIKELPPVRRRRKSRLPYMLISMFFTTIVLLICMHFLIDALTSPVSANNEDAISQSGGGQTPDDLWDDQNSQTIYRVPGFEGMYLDAVKSMADYNVRFTLKVEYEYSEQVQKDIIIEQDIERGYEVAGGETVEIKVTVSKGQIELPNLDGLEQELAVSTIKELLDIEPEIIEKHSDTVAAGQVIQCDRGNGKVILYISLGPEEASSNFSNSNGGSVYDGEEYSYGGSDQPWHNW